MLYGKVYAMPRVHIIPIIASLILCACKGVETNVIVFQRPANYQELGKIIIEKIKAGEYSILKELWPDDKTCRSWIDSCDSTSMEYDHEKAFQKIDRYRNTIGAMIKNELREVHDLKNAALKSVYYKNTNKCPQLFRTNGEIEIVFTTGHDDYALYCAHAGETKEEKIYLMDSLLLRKEAQ